MKRRYVLAIGAAVAIGLALLLAIRRHECAPTELEGDSEGSRSATAPSGPSLAARAIPPPPTTGGERLAAPGPAVPLAPGTVVVSIRGDADEPLANVSVTIRAHGDGPVLGPVETDQGGIAHFARVPVGEAWAFAKGPSREQGGTPLQVRAEGETTVRVVLRALVPVAGRVLLPSGEGVAAFVRVTREGTVAGETETCGGAWCEVTRTSCAPDGAFRVEIPPNRIVTITASAEGYAPSGIALRRGKEGDEVLLTLEPGGTLQGTVRGPDGKPCAGAKVFVVPADEPAFLENPRFLIGTDGSMSWSNSDDTEAQFGGASRGSPGASGTTKRAIRATTSADGTFEVTSLRIPAVYRTLAEGCGGGRGASAETPLSPSSRSATTNVSLEPRAILVVRLEAPDGSVPNGQVGLTLVGAREHFLDPRGGAMSCDDIAAGRGRFDGLVAGTYELRVDMEGSVPVRRAVEVSASGTNEVTVRGVAGLSLKGFVFDRSGKVVERADVHFEIHEAAGVADQTVRTASREDGSFLLAGLQAASGQLAVQKEGYGLLRLDDVRPGAEPIRAVLPPAAELRGRLVIRNGASLPADVWIAEHDGKSTRGMQIARVASNGAFRYYVARVGEPTAYVMLPRVGAPIPLGRFALRAEEIRDLGAVEVDDGRVLRGRVTDPRGQPVVGVRVEANPRDAPDLGDGQMVSKQEDTTDAEGRFAIRGVAKGPAVVTTTHPTLASSEEEDSGQGDLSIVLHPGAFLSGRLLDATGAPRSAVRIRVVLSTPLGERALDEVTDARGSFALGPIQAAPFVIYVVARDGSNGSELAGGSLGEGERKVVEWRAP